MTIEVRIVVNFSNVVEWILKICLVEAKRIVINPEGIMWREKNVRPKVKTEMPISKKSICFI